MKKIAKKVFNVPEPKKLKPVTEAQVKKTVRFMEEELPGREVAIMAKTKEGCLCDIRMNGLSFEIAMMSTLMECGRNWTEIRRELKAIYKGIEKANRESE